MKKYYLAVLPLMLFAILVTSIDVRYVRAPEYFADGRMYILQRGDSSAGIIVGWGVYAIRISTDGCIITPIISPLHDAQSVECAFEYNDNGTVFRGWLDFRGHPRPFCGAIKQDNIPAKCGGHNAN